MFAMQDMLALSASLPAVEFAPGDIVVPEGGSSGALWILVSGALALLLSAGVPASQAAGHLYASAVNIGPAGWDRSRPYWS
jgi:hypothetical protein